MNKLPKILVINEQSIYKDNATGITLRGLFRDWPDAALLELRFDANNYENNGRHESICAIDSFPLQKVMRSKSRHKSIKKVDNTNHVIKDSVPSSSAIKSRIRRILINMADLSWMRIPRQIYEKIETYSPDVIYTIGGSVSVMKMVNRISIVYDIPVVMHFMDDWPHHLQDENGLGQKIYKKQIQKWLKLIYKRTKICIAISDKMAEIYQKETGIRHISLMNSVNVESLICDKKEKSDSIVFSYAGGLHLDRWKALVQIQDTIKQLANQNNIKAEFRIYTKPSDRDKYRYQFDPNITTFFDFVKHDEIKCVYEKSDVLVHAEVINPLLIGYFRFSISTKIPEYLATGRTVLFFGPKEMGLYAYLNDASCALVASNEVELIDCICKIFSDDSSLECIQNNAISFVKEKHDQDSSIAKLTALICTVSEKGNDDGR